MIRLLTAFILSTVLLNAQSTGELRGRVLDSSGAVVPNATLTLTGAVNKRATAAADGAFVITGLAPGDYSIRATAPGFANAENKLNIGAGRIATLDLQLTIATQAQQVDVADAGAQAQVSVDANTAASSTVLRGEDLNVFSDNPADLMGDLLSLAGPAAGPGGGQVLIDGFSNGQLPPKELIREVRINSNPFSAEFDRPGFGQVQIITKPGAAQYHGTFGFNFADSALNSRNPFSDTKPQTQSRGYQGNLTGPISKKASFILQANRFVNDSSALIVAEAVDASLQPVSVRQDVLTPQSNFGGNARLDYAVAPNATLQFIYAENRSSAKGNDVGQFSLISRATDSENVNRSIQASETQVIGTRLIDETRFQFTRNRNDSNGDSSTPVIVVQYSFTGGGARFSRNYANSDNYEFQNNATYIRNGHLIRLGVRIRGSMTEGYSTSNYNGTYTFSSLDSYIATLRGVQQGLSGAQIRALGGGAQQYSVNGGNPLAAVSMVDASPFIQDEVHLKPNVTLTLGMRYEVQNNIRNQASFAPRAGLAWGIGKTQGARPPRTVLRFGWGLFYDRVVSGLNLQAIRQNGINQQSFVIAQPDFFPNAPVVADLASHLQPQAIYKVDAAIQAPQTMLSAITLERQIHKNATLSVVYSNLRGIHQLRSRNINAPLPNAVMPYGSSGPIYLYESSGLFEQNRFLISLNVRVASRLTLIGNLALGRYRSNSEGSGNFPANSYDLSGEWARANGDHVHNSSTTANIQLPLKVNLASTLNLGSSGPVDITTGTDLNGDSIFNDRPAFGTVAANPAIGVIATPWGVFNSDPVNHPQYGSVIVPRNYGTGTPFFGMFSTLRRTWSFGEKGRYNVTLSLNARNTLNHVNAADPVSVLTSPFLGHSIQSVYQANANRRLLLGINLSF